MVTRIHSINGMNNYAVARSIRKVEGKPDMTIYSHELMYDILLDSMLNDKRFTEIK